MKRVGKIAVKIAGICLGVGCILLIISVAMGADLSLIEDGFGLRGWRHRHSQDGLEGFEEEWEDWTEDWHEGRHGGHGGRYWEDLREDRQLSFPASEVAGLRIDFQCGGVQVAREDVEDVEVYTNGQLSRFSSRQEGSTLILENEGLEDKNARMLILLPLGMELEELDARIAKGMLMARDLSVARLDLDVGAGYTGYSGDIGESCTARTSAGAIELYVRGAEEDFYYTVRSDIGQVAINGRAFSGLSFSQTLGEESAGKHMDLQCSVGSIEVNNIDTQGGEA